MKSAILSNSTSIMIGHEVNFSIKTFDNNIRYYRATYNVSTGKWVLDPMLI
ncbi:hypothetical protein ACQCVH_06660 [Bacillus infantis]|uniref:hypothetical protein n=1 Tax=Bacillus infantis TaxID=324767 RepID=UPI003CF352D2